MFINLAIGIVCFILGSFLTAKYIEYNIKAAFDLGLDMNVVFSDMRKHKK